MHTTHKTNRAMAACAAVACVLALATGMAWAGAMTARDYFAMLPATIFESTPEGLPDLEKRQLLERGRTEFWEVREENPDVLLVASRPFGETWVNVRVFRDDAPSDLDREGHGELVALGTQSVSGTSVCTLELWRADRKGRIVPVDTPPDPDPAEFFEGSKSAPTLPQGTRVSILFCLHEHGLEALPLFWNQRGMLHLPVRNEIHYRWEKGVFQKELVPLNHKNHQR